MEALDATRDADPADQPEELRTEARRWLEAIKEAIGREKTWRDEAEWAEACYTMNPIGLKAPKGDLPRYNILHSNVETTIPAIISSMPKPDIRPRHNREGDVPRVIADVLEAGISTQIDDSRLDRVLEKVAQDAYVAGRGIMRAEFRAKVADDGAGGRQVTDEKVCYRNISWKDYCEGPATRWEDVPWIAFRHIISQEEAKRREGKVIPVGGAVSPVVGQEDRPNERDDVVLWEIWEKATRKIFFVREHDSYVERVVDDPLALRGFFPIPEPLQPITATGSRRPVCPFTIYRDLAEELNLVSTRIAKIMEGMKVRGFIVALANTDMTALANADDNEVVPLTDMDHVMQNGGLEKAVMFWPIDRASQALKELYVQREQARSAIYEITGISDIMRGESDSRETASAQNLKSEYGAMRLSRMQKFMQWSVRDMFVITAEILSNNFTPATLQQISGIQFENTPAMALLEKPLKHHVIDVETDSTIMGDRRKFQQEFADLTNGVGAFVERIAQLGQMFPEAAEGLIGLLGVLMKHANLGREGEQHIRDIIDQARQGLAARRQAEQQAAEQAEKQGKAEEAQAKLQQEAQNRAMAHEQKMAELNFKMEQSKAELDLKHRELELRIAEFEAKTGIEVAKVENQADKDDAEIAIKERQTTDAKENADLDRAQNAEQFDATRADDNANAALDRESAERQGDKDRNADSANQDLDRKAAADEGDAQRDAAADEGDKNRRAAAKEGAANRAAASADKDKDRQAKGAGDG